MAIIGTFNKFEDGKYYGTLSSLTFETEAVIEPAKKHGDKSPTFASPTAQRKLEQPGNAPTREKSSFRSDLTIPASPHR